MVIFGNSSPESERGRTLSFFLKTFVAFCILYDVSAGPSNGGQECIIEPSVYTCEQLIALCKPALLCQPALLPGARPEVPKELQRRRRGCRAGAKQRAKKRRHRPVVPAIVMGNLRFLGNKTDKLAALIKTQREYRECSVLCFRETWLHSHIPDHSVAVPGFNTVRVDRDVISSGQKKGGGIVMYVSERRCNPGHVHVKLRVMGVDDTMISRITDYLTGRPQFVHMGSVLSDVVVSDTGAPQGTVLSPFLFTLYTTDFSTTPGRITCRSFLTTQLLLGV